MSDFFTRLAARTLGLGATVAPDMPPDFDGVRVAPPGEADDVDDWTAAAAASERQSRNRPQPPADPSPLARPGNRAALSAADGSGGPTPDERVQEAAPSPDPAAGRRHRSPVRPQSSQGAPKSADPVQPYRAAPADPPHPAVPAPPAFVPPPPRAVTPHASPLAGAEAHETPQPALEPLVRRAASAHPRRTTGEASAESAAEALEPGLPRPVAPKGFLPFAEPAREAAVDTAETRNEPAEPTTVKVTIGRIEVRADPPKAVPRPAPRRRGLSLDDYLRQRSGRA